MFYTSAPNVLVSDHRPVIAYYKVNVKKINETKKQLAEKELYKVMVVVLFGYFLDFIEKKVNDYSC